MVIEWIGPPGSGKTTLLPTVTAWLKTHGVNAFTIAEAARPFAARTLLGRALAKVMPPSLHRRAMWPLFYGFSLVYRIRFAARHPRLIWLVIRSQTQRPPSADVRQRKVLYWFFHLVGYYEFLTAHAAPGEALVIDEGFAHRVVQLFASDAETPDAASLRRYLDLIPKPDLVIAIRAPWQVCARRVFGRGVWDRARHKEPDQIARFVAHAALAVDLAVDRMAQNGWHVITVDNGGDDLAWAQDQLQVRIATAHPIAADRVAL